MTHSEYLRALRCLYHENLHALKSAKEHFNNQFKKMQKAHKHQISTLESFAIKIAIEKFSS